MNAIKPMPAAPLASTNSTGLPHVHTNTAGRISNLSEQNQSVLRAIILSPNSDIGVTNAEILNQTGLLMPALQNSLHGQSALRNNDYIENASTTSIARWRVTEKGRAKFYGEPVPKPQANGLDTVWNELQKLSEKQFRTPGKPPDLLPPKTSGASLILNYESDPPLFLSITNNQEILIVSHDQVLTAIAHNVAMPLANFLRSLPDNHPLLAKL